MSDLWAALGIQSPESIESQNCVRRVVLVGHATSGKRTIAMNLRAAVQQHQQHQFSTFSASSASQSVAPSSGASAAAVLGSRTSGGASGKVVGSTLRRTNFGAGTSTGSGASRVTLDSVDLSASHGAGVAHTYATLRLPASLLAPPTPNFRRTTSMASYAGTESPTPESSVASGSTGTWMPLTGTPTSDPAASPSGPLRKLTTEFFCCDCADALWVALPTLEALETCVVVFVVDLAEAERMQEQLKEWRTAVHEHVLAVMKLFAPKQDEVRRMRMVEGARRFWDAQRRALEQLSDSKWRDRDDKDAPLCAVTSSDQASSKEGESCAAVLGGENVCALPSIVVFNKFDLLERAAKEVVVKANMKGQPLVAPSSDSPDPNALARAASQLAAILGEQRQPSQQQQQQEQQQSVLSIAAQFLRKEAMAMNSAFVSLGSRVNFTTSGATSATSGAGRSVGPFNGSGDVGGNGKNTGATIQAKPAKSGSTNAEADAPSRARGSRMYPSSFGDEGDDASMEDPAGMAGSGASESDVTERGFSAKDRRQRLSALGGAMSQARQGGSAAQSTTLVHPVYKALWSYIFQLLYGALSRATLSSHRGALASMGNLRGSSPGAVTPSSNADAASQSLRNDDEAAVNDGGRSPGRKSSLQSGLRTTSLPTSPASSHPPQATRLPDDVENASTFAVGHQGFLPHGMDSPRYLDSMIVESYGKWSAYDHIFMLRRLMVNHLVGLQDDEAQLILSSSTNVAGASKSTQDRWASIQSEERGATTLDKAGIKVHAFYLEQMAAALRDAEPPAATTVTSTTTTATETEPAAADVLVWDEFT